MKRVVYTSFVFVGLFLASCSKEEIKPNYTGSSQVPVLKSTSGGAVKGDSNTEPTEDGTTSGGSTTGESTITDPNNDRDENIRRKN